MGLLIFQHIHFYTAGHIRSVIDSMMRNDKIGLLRLKNILNKSLRIAVKQRKPGALNLNHNPVVALECM